MDDQALIYAPNEVQIDLSRIRSNLRAMRRVAGVADVMAVVKANAYGHGSVMITRTLRDAGVRFFAVAQLPEAIELRAAGIAERILVFGAPTGSDLPAYLTHGLDLVVASEETVGLLAGQPGLDGLCVHLKIDTGMHRLGIPVADAATIITALKSTPGLRLSGLWTHLASSDEPAAPLTAAQLRAFEPLARQYGNEFDHVHVAASSGLWNFGAAATHPDRALVRLGISLYGYLENERTSEAAGIAPAMRFVSRVAQVRAVRAGQGVSYNTTWTARQDSVVATVAAGYADGYPRLLSNRSQVGIDGKRFQAVGTICMDMFIINLGPVQKAPSVPVGSPVVLFGHGGPSAFEVAAWGDTIVYEVCTNIASRVRRTYV